MKWFFVAIVLSVAGGCGAGGQAEFQFDGQAAMEYVRTQMDFGPRIPNTEGHQQTGDWIQARLEETADQVEVQAFEHVSQDGDTLYLRNFIGRFLPDRTDRILFVVHWDTRPIAEKSSNMADRRRPTPGANDGASGVALLLGLADELSRVPPAYGVDLLFVDGEDYGNFSTKTDVFLGSTYFAENLPDGYRPLFAVVWDMIADAELQLPREGNSVRGAPEVVERVWRVADELGFGGTFTNEIGTWVEDDHIPLLDAGIRAIDVIDFTYGGPTNPYHHTVEDTVDKLSAESLSLVGTVALALVR
ncbi:MAG: M28 family peptidase [Gemmatimonadota bacterium]|nr:M28 family peptidase [Gemmatimonadota bacterium]